MRRGREQHLSGEIDEDVKVGNEPLLLEFQKPAPAEKTEPAKPAETSAATVTAAAVPAEPTVREVTRETVSAPNIAPAAPSP